MTDTRDIATVTVYSGSRWITVTGRIVHRAPSGAGLAVEDARGVRWYAPIDRVAVAATAAITVNASVDDNNHATAYLW